DANTLAAVADGGEPLAHTATALPPYTTLFRSDGTVGVAPLQDTATLSGGYNPGGVVHFVLTGPVGFTTYTEDVTISGNGTYSTTAFTSTLAGTYIWTASYAGDGNNFAAIDDNGAHPTVVHKPQPHTVTTANTDRT